MTGEGQTSPKLVYWSAGEASGDHHAAGVIRCLRQLDPQIRHRGLGGEAMRAAGMDLIRDMARDFAIIGFTRAVIAYPALRRILRETVADWHREKPALLVCVDYPGFNLVLAQKAFEHKIPVVWYISPQVWAWKAGRVRTMRAVLKRVLVILPFEEEWLRQRGVQADYVGNPILDEMEGVLAPQPDARVALGLTGSGPVIGLLPGSRSREILRHMPLLVSTARQLLARHPDLQFVLPVAPTIDEADICHALAKERDLSIMVTKDALRARMAMDAALCKSGTSTLELALCGVPMVIFYITSALNAWIARRFLQISVVGLVNLVAGKLVVRECIQEEAQPQILARELACLLPGQGMRAVQLAELERVRQLLGQPGASERVARIIFEEIQAAQGAAG